MKKIIIKLLIFSSPFFCLILAYVLSDPFKIIYNYDTYLQNNKPIGVTLNKDYISIETLLKNYKEQNYNSFIFGNSRSIFYPTSEWQNYIGTTTNCLHIDAAGESLYGIYRKFSLIDSLNIPLKNALIVLDTSVLNQLTNSNNHLFIKHYKTTGQSWLTYQLLFLKDFLSSPKFIFAYFDFIISKKIKPYMKANSILSEIICTYNNKTNEIAFPELEDSIINYTELYYSNKTTIFHRPDSVLKESKPVIGSQHLTMLKYIKNIFTKNQTEYRIIINPLYDQKKISSEDLKMLEECFGKQNVYDFSGKNEFTEDQKNYYEASHYRPIVSKQILKIIYTRKYN